MGAKPSAEELSMQFRHEPSAADARDVLRLTRQEAARGTMREVTVTILNLCAHCNSETGFCPTCAGWGIVRVGGFFRRKRTCCPTCAGDGLVHNTACPGCAGTGQIQTTVSHQIQVPAGVDTGTQLRLVGQGHRLHPRYARGDLYLRIEVE